MERKAVQWESDRITFLQNQMKVVYLRFDY